MENSKFLLEYKEPLQLQCILSYKVVSKSGTN